MKKITLKKALAASNRIQYDGTINGIKGTITEGYESIINYDILTIEDEKYNVQLSKFKLDDCSVCIRDDQEIYYNGELSKLVPSKVKTNDDILLTNWVNDLIKAYKSSKS